jgi:alkylhydroperoxidase/carboxymuconolactone decarboxylase family protein YurZ
LARRSPPSAPTAFDTHTKHGCVHGASREEIAEAALVAVAVKTGSARWHSLLALRIFDDEKGGA